MKLKKKNLFIIKYLKIINYLICEYSIPYKMIKCIIKKEN